MAKKKRQALPAATTNPVAKYAHRFNRAVRLTNKRTYQRKGKFNKGFPFDVLRDLIFGLTPEIA